MYLHLERALQLDAHIAVSRQLSALHCVLLERHAGAAPLRLL